MIAQKPYRIVERNIFTSRAVSSMLVRDKHWEGFSKEDIRAVFDYSYTELQEKLNSFHNLSRKVSDNEERELTFLFEALLKSRKLLDT